MNDTSYHKILQYKRQCEIDFWQQVSWESSKSYHEQWVVQVKFQSEVFILSLRFSFSFLGYFEPCCVRRSESHVWRWISLRAILERRRQTVQTDKQRRCSAMSSSRAQWLQSSRLYTARQPKQIASASRSKLLLPMWTWRAYCASLW